MIGVTDPIEALLHRWNGHPECFQPLLICAPGRDGCRYGIALSVDHIVAQTDGRVHRHPFDYLGIPDGVLAHCDAAFLFREPHPEPGAAYTDEVQLVRDPVLLCGEQGDEAVVAVLDIGGRLYRLVGRDITTCNVHDPDGSGMEVGECVIKWNWSVEP